MKKLPILISAFILFAFSQPAGLLAAVPGDKIVSFTSKAMSGETISIDKVIKNKPVLLFFWATW